MRWPFALSGLLAAAAGMAAGHFVAALMNPASSPVLAVGSAVVDATPTPVKEWAVRTLGTSDKLVLLTTVAVVTALAAAGIGLLSRRRETLALVLLVGLASLAGLAALTRAASTPADLLPSLVAAGVGAVVLSWLRRLAEQYELAAAQGRPESPLAHSAYARGQAGTPARRSFLLGAAGAAAGAAVLGALGRSLGSGTVPTSVTLPAPSTTAPPLPTGLEHQVKGVSPFRTPVNDFYRIDTSLIIPRVDVDSWRLYIDGEVERPFSLTFAELLKMPLIEKDVTLNCVSNEVGGPYISSARWLGVRVRDLWERAGIRSGVDQVLSSSTGGFTSSTPVEAFTDDREALVVVGMDGQALPSVHGFPVRLVTPGLYGFVGATKWLTRMTATTYAAQQAYWTQRGWATTAPVKTQSRIDTPAGLGTYAPGKLAIGGVAWAQTRGISRVEVRVDQGPWQQATLGPDAGTDYWRQWYLIWDASHGRHQLTVRATDGKGDVQTDKAVDPFPDGASGYHSIVVVIS